MLFYFILCGLINLVIGFISGYSWVKRRTVVVNGLSEEEIRDRLENAQLAEEARELQKSYKE